MRDDGKVNVCGVLVDVVDYEGATARIVDAGRDGRPLAATALAVHGLVEATRDGPMRHRVNHLDLVTPDGQPVRWAMNRLHRAGLDDRVYGPTLMLRVCAAAAAAGLPVFLYGSAPAVLEPLARNLQARFPGLVVAGSEPSKFGRVDAGQRAAIAGRIRASGARIVFVGLGCPRQEVFAFEQRDLVGLPLLAVGAAFDYHAGLLREPPGWIQRAGLQWAWRIAAEPRRLFARYASTNPRYVAMVAAQATGRWRPATDAPPPESAIGWA